TCFASAKQQLTSLRAQVFELDVLERDLHDVVAMQLPGNYAFIGHAREIVVNRSFPIELDCHVLANALDVVVIKILGLKDFLDQFWIGLLHEAAFGFSIRAEVLTIKRTPKDLPNISLWTGDGKLLSIENLAANLDAAVSFSIFHANLEGQLKVFVVLLTAQKGVEGDFFVAVRADNRPVLYGPKLVDQPFPSLQVFAVEECLGRVVLRSARRAVRPKCEWSQSGE